MRIEIVGKDKKIVLCDGYIPSQEVIDVYRKVLADVENGKLEVVTLPSFFKLDNNV